MNGNRGEDQVHKFLQGDGKWKFHKIVVINEHEVLPKTSWGLWPKLYNHLMKMGSNPLVTYWSDDIFPEKNCFKLGAAKFADADVGAVAFAWRDGESKPYRIYGTEMHKQVMINFGLFRRTILQEVNYIDENYKFYNADQDVSLKVWYVGKKVVRCEQAKVTHFSGVKSGNEYRNGNHYRNDSRRFSSKWAYSNVKNRKVKL